MNVLKRIHFPALVIFFLLVSGSLTAQRFSAGVNTETPNPNAVLHLVSPQGNQGLLLPSLTTTQRTTLGGSLTAADNGLMVFDSDVNAFFFWVNGTGWIATTNTDEQDLANVLGQNNDAGGVAIENVADPVNPQDVATKNYVDNLSVADNQDLTLAGNTLSLTNDPTSIDLSPFLDNTDNQNLSNVLAAGNDAGAITITNLPTPVNPADVATKSYVDNNGGNQSLTLTGSDLTIDNGNTIDLSGLGVAGDVTGNLSNAIVSNIGGQTAADVATATLIVNSNPNLDLDANDDLDLTAVPNAAGDISGDFATGLFVDFVGGSNAADVSTATTTVLSAPALDLDANDDLALTATPNTAGDISGDYASGLLVDFVGGEAAADIASATLTVLGAPALDLDANDDLALTTAPNAAGDISGDFSGGLFVDFVGGSNAADISSATSIVLGNPNLDLDSTNDLDLTTVPNGAGDVSGDFGGGLFVDFVGGQSAADIGTSTAIVIGNPNLDLDATDDLSLSTVPNAAGDISGDFASGLVIDPNSVTNAEIADGTIINADINAAAAIGWTKIDKTGANVSELANDAGYLGSGSNISTLTNDAGYLTAVTSADITDGEIVDADINAAAAIGWTKIDKTGANVSELANDAGYLGSGSNISTLTNDAGYLTAVTSTDITNGEIVDADINAAAAIGWTKIDKTGANVSDLSNDAGYITTELDPTVPANIKDGIDWTEVTSRPAGLDDGDDVGLTVVTSADITDGEIVNADINAAAAIGWTKIDKTGANVSDLSNDAGYITTELDPTVPANIKDGIDWTEVTSRPAGLDDGDDVGLTVVTSADITDGEIVNADINAAAAIGWTKIDKTGANVSDLSNDAGYITTELDPTVPANIKDGIDWTEVTSRPAGLDDGDDVGLTVVTSADITDGEIVNADINAAAAIGWTKIDKTGANVSDLSNDAGYITTELDPTVPANIKDGIDWTEVTSRPAGLDDGDDVGLTVVTSADITDGEIVNADINAAAAIGWTKIDKTGANVSDLSNDAGYITTELDPTVPANIKDGIDWTEVTSRPAGLDDGDDVGLTVVTSADITDGEIVNADINAAAAIAGTKVNPSFGTQNITTSGSLNAGAISGTSFTGNGSALTNLNTNTSLSFNSTPADGDVLAWDNTNSRWDATTPAAPTLNNGFIFVGDGGNNAVGVSMSGDVTIDNAGATSITNNAIVSAKIADDNVTLAKIQNGTANQVLVTDGVGNPVYIAQNTLAVGSATDLVAGGSVVSDAEVDNNITIDGGSIDNTVVGGTTAAAGTFTSLNAGAISGTSFTGNGSALTNLNTNTSLSFNSTPADGDVLAWDNTNSRWDATTPAAPTLNNGFIFVGDGGNNAVGVSMSGDVTIDNAGATTITNNAIVSAKIADDNVTLAKIQNGTANQVLGTDGSGNPVYIAQNTLAVGSATDLVAGGSVVSDAEVDNNITIDGGSIDNTVVGGTTAAAGTFTSLNAGAISGTSFSGNGSALTNLNTNTSLSFNSTPADGDVLAWDNTNSRWDATTPAAPTLNNGFIFVGDGGNNAVGVSMSGDVTIDNAGATTITNNAIVSAKIADDNVTLAKIQNGTANQVLGTDGSGNPVYIAQNTLAVGSATDLVAGGSVVSDAEVDNNITIDGGSIDNTVVGGTTAAAGTFTSLNAGAISGTSFSGNGSALTNMNTNTSLSFNATPADGDVLAWDNTNSRWDAIAPASPLNSGNGVTINTNNIDLGGALTATANITTNTGFNLVVDGINGEFITSTGTTSFNSSTINLGDAATDDIRVIGEFNFETGVNDLALLVSNQTNAAPILRIPDLPSSDETLALQSDISWVVSAPDIYYTGGNVGIGTNTPGTTLDVAGGVFISNNTTTGSLNVDTDTNLNGNLFSPADAAIFPASALPASIDRRVIYINFDTDINGLPTGQNGQELIIIARGTGFNLNAVGNVQLNGDTPFFPSRVGSNIHLIFDSVLNLWLEITRSN